jgi:hypothetical protein
MFAQGRSGAPGRPSFARVVSASVLLVVMVLGSGAVGPAAGTSASTERAPSSEAVPAVVEFSGPASTPPTNVTLSVNASSANLSDAFWGTTINNEARLLPGETNAVNATPSRVLVWPGAMAGEDYDPFTDTHYETDDGVPTHALTNESQFVTMCKAIRCLAIMQVPAEIDDPSIAEAIVNYTEVNLSFTPAYWMIGNEPELWEHWKVPWSKWGSEYTDGPTPTEFGHEVVAYVDAIRAVDATTPILGLPASGCTCGSYTYAQWIAGVLNVTGDHIQAVAFHEYPAGWLGTGNGSLEAFYGTIQSAANIPTRVAAARKAIETACPGCNVSLFVSELGAALSWSSYGPYAAGFSGALSIASQVTQAMDVNLTNVDLFAAELNTTNSWFNTGGVARPDYALYTQVLDHLGPQAFPVSVPGLGKTLYAIDTIAPGDHGRRDLLVVNDNITHAISFAPAFAENAGDGPVAAWSWAGTIHYSGSNDTNWVEPATANPLLKEFPGGLPANYTLAPQAMVLFESYPSTATYVLVGEQGVPSGVAWYASVGGSLHTTTAQNLSLFLPAGAYPISAQPIPLPLGGREPHPAEQLAGYVASPVTVGGGVTDVPIDFATQWRVNASAMPSVGGTVTPNATWANASEPVTFTESPLPGYAFVGWSGWGPGGYNGSHRTATVLPTGRVVERARFAPGEAVLFWEGGLPTGTPWSVTVRDLPTNSSSDLLTVYEPSGVFGYSVTSIPGYRVTPENSSFLVDGPGLVIRVEFIAIHPPGLQFPVTFLVSGLPAGVSVPITVRGDVETAGSTDPEFPLWNGSYAYHVGYVAGYHAAVPDKTFQVGGLPMTILVPFVPTVYTASWAAQGTRVGLNWSVEIGGSAVPASSAWVSAPLTNGSYNYTISVPPNYSATPRTGSLSVDGEPIQLSLVFTLLEFPTGFQVTGPGASASWSVRLGNLTRATAADHVSFLAPNGTYTFDVQAPNGYYAVPSHGTVTIAGATPMVAIVFHPSSLQPSAALVAALSSTALTVSLWTAAAVIGGFAVMRGLRRRGG